MQMLRVRVHAVSATFFFSFTVIVTAQGKILHAEHEALETLRHILKQSHLYDSAKKNSTTLSCLGWQKYESTK